MEADEAAELELLDAPFMLRAQPTKAFRNWQLKIQLRENQEEIVPTSMPFQILSLIQVQRPRPKLAAGFAAALPVHPWSKRADTSIS